MTVYTHPFTRLESPSAVALGFFDGVHKGHQSVITKMSRYAKSNGLQAVIWTFDSSPKEMFLKEKCPVISTESDKKNIFSSLGADALITFPFNEEISTLSCESFVKDILKDNLKANKVFCGFNYSFGAGGKGNADTLISLCLKHGIKTEVVPPVTSDGLLVSSSRIRTLIENGDVKTASQMLGRPYSINAKVVVGNRLGRKLGFPTINQTFTCNGVIPKKGVYVSKISFCENEFFGITNVGTKPTVGENLLGAETHVFDFDGDLYGKHIKTEFLEYIRSEKKFDSVENLIEQIMRDIKSAESIIGTK